MKNILFNIKQIYLKNLLTLTNINFLIPYFFGFSVLVSIFIPFVSSLSMTSKTYFFLFLGLKVLLFYSIHKTYLIKNKIIFNKRFVFLNNHKKLFVLNCVNVFIYLFKGFNPIYFVYWYILYFLGATYFLIKIKGCYVYDENKKNDNSVEKINTNITNDTNNANKSNGLKKINGFKNSNVIAKKKTNFYNPNHPIASFIFVFDVFVFVSLLIFMVICTIIEPGILIAFAMGGGVVFMPLILIMYITKKIINSDK